MMGWDIAGPILFILGLAFIVWLAMMMQIRDIKKVEKDYKDGKIDGYSISPFHISTRKVTTLNKEVEE